MAEVVVVRIVVVVMVVVRIVVVIVVDEVLPGVVSLKRKTDRK